MISKQLDHDDQLVIVMMINDHADGEDHDKTPLMFMAVMMMINDHAFSLHPPSDVNRGAAAYSWVNR